MYSANLTEQEILDIEENIKKFNENREEGTGDYKTFKIMVENTRVVKDSDGNIQYRVGSVEKHENLKVADNMEVVFGDHSAFLKAANVYLSEAKKWAANDN